jgi:hypothetical protein
MTIGELDRRAIIEYPVSSANTYGEQETTSWSTFRTVWAKVEWDSGDETEETDKITGITKVNFYIRNLDLDTFLDASNAPTMAHRIQFTPEAVAKYYYINSIEEIAGTHTSNRERFLKIKTKQKDS